MGNACLQDEIWLDATAQFLEGNNILRQLDNGPTQPIKLIGILIKNKCQAGVSKLIDLFGLRTFLAKVSQETLSKLGKTVLNHQSKKRKTLASGIDALIESRCRWFRHMTISFDAIDPESMEVTPGGSSMSFR